MSVARTHREIIETGTEAIMRDRSPLRVVAWFFFPKWMARRQLRAAVRRRAADLYCDELRRRKCSEAAILLFREWIER